MNGIYAFFHGVGVAIGTIFITVGAFFAGQPQPLQQPPSTTVSTTSIQAASTPTEVPDSSNEGGRAVAKKPASLPAVHTTPAPVIQVPMSNSSVDQQTQSVTQEPPLATKGYYENGSYVYLTDAEHQALLQQLHSSIQGLKNQEQPYIDDLNKSESAVQSACAATLSGSPIGEGNSAIVAQTQASICSSTSQAYGPSIQIDRQAIDYYDSKIQSLESSYN